MKRYALIGLSLMLLLAVAAATPGCAKKEAEKPSKPIVPTESVTPTPTPTPPTAQRLLYFNRGEYVGVAGRQVVDEGDVANRIELTLEALLAGPSADDLRFGLTGTSIPAGTVVNGVTVDGDLATVDLSARFASGGGSLSMLLRVAQVVYTVTQFPDVTRVAFALDGAAARAIGGEGIVVDPPVNRADFEDQTPPILVEHPVPGQEVTSPIKVSGTSNVFEAQSNVDVKDPAGTIITQHLITATSGTGTRGTFEASIPYDTPLTGLGSVVFFDISPKDGAPIDVIEIPVVLK